MKKILAKGVAGFIASKVLEMLLKDGYNVIRVDNLNDYYDIQLELWSFDNLEKYSNFKFNKIDV